MSTRKPTTITAIGSISNYYGGLAVKQEDGKFYWSIENWDGSAWVEIPQYLFDTLVRYENERLTNQTKES